MLSLCKREWANQKKALWKWLTKNFSFDPDVIRTRNLLIWSQTRYSCAAESYILQKEGHFIVNVDISLGKLKSMK